MSITEVRTASEAAPLLLLHGFTGCPQSWDRTIAGLGTRRHCLVPALLGHDGTPGEGGADSFEGEVDRLAALVRTSSLGRLELAGYSLGARVALGLLVKHAGLFERGTLFGAHPGLAVQREREARQRSDDAWRKLLLEAAFEVFLSRWESQPLFASQQQLPRALWDQQRTWRMAHHPSGLARALSTLGLGSMPYYGRSLGKLGLPVHLVVGELDTKFLALAQQMLPFLPRGRLTVIPHTGHNILLEQPTAAARVLESWGLPEATR